MSDYKEIPCNYCGRIIRDTDRFCIFCGKTINKPSASSNIWKGNDSEREEMEKEVDHDLGNHGFMQSAIEKDHQEDENLSRKERKAKQKEDEHKEEIAEINDKIELDDSIKEKLHMKIELVQIDKKKVKLKQKLETLTTSLDKSRYEYDVDYAKTINIKLKAFKGVKDELLGRENELREQMGGSFRIDILREEVGMRREQLIELKRSYKRRKINKDVYLSLKEEYKSKYDSAKRELGILISGIVRWNSLEKSNKIKEEVEIRLLAGRLKSREIDQEEHDAQLSKINKKIDVLNETIEILERYSIPLKSSFFK